jgi:hypothetical protein
MATALITEFKKLVAPDVLPCPDPMVNREVLSIMLEFCKKTNILQRDFELEVDSDEIDTDLQDSIDFDISEWSNDLRPVAVLEIQIDGTSFLPVSRNIRNTHTDFDGSNDARVRYFWIPNDHTIRVFDLNANLSRIWLNISVKPLRNATEVDDTLLEDWSEAIVAGAKWKLLSAPGKEWSDPVAGEFYRREYRKYLSQAKAQVLRGATGVYQETVQWKSFGED